MSSQLLTADEVAERLKKKKKTLANWRSQGIGPSYIKTEAASCTAHWTSRSG